MNFSIGDDRIMKLWNVYCFDIDCIEMNFFKFDGYFFFIYIVIFFLCM